MNKLKFNKSTIFTLLGIVVIVASIPLAVILVNQRQEIRKEAAQSCGSWCASVVGHADYPWCICNADRSPASGYTEKSRTTTSDCTSSCVAYSSSSNEGGDAAGHPVWGLYQTGLDCSVTSTPTPTPTRGTTPTPTPTGKVTPTPTPTSTLTPTPTPTGTVTPTPTGTITPTPTGTVTPTPTGTITPTPTGTVTPTPTGTITPTPITVAQATPSAELPEAGFALPTFGAIIGGILLIVASLVFIL